SAAGTTAEGDEAVQAAPVTVTAVELGEPPAKR
ncbi:MAG: Valine-tRNA ligase, partial [Actinomyces urogenitalis DORA_12]